MELDALREKWAEHDRKLDGCIRIHRGLLDARQIDRARSALQWHALGLGIETVMSIAVLFVLGSYTADHIARVRFALLGLHLCLVQLVILIDLIRQIVLTASIGPDQPITVNQKRLERLRMMSIRHLQGVLLVSPLVWTPLLIVALNGLLGVDAYRVFGLRFLGANLAVGVAVIPIAFVLSRRFGTRLKRTSAVRRLADAIAGSQLNAARGFLRSIAEFEAGALPG